MNAYNKNNVNYEAIKDSKKLLRLLAFNGINNSKSSKAMTRSESLRLFRITPKENKPNGYFDISEFISSTV
ncbi:MAG: hypothetical protein ACYDCN_09975 [Bacteroidia bacterium]